MSRDADGGGGQGEEGLEIRGEGVSSDAAVHRSKAEGQKETRENAGRRNGKEQRNQPFYITRRCFARVTQRRGK